MAVKLITEESEKDVTLLKDADVQYVSLVRHGANRMPFRVVKHEKGGEKANMRYAIQSIILPKGGELSKMAQAPGLEYLSEAHEQHRKDFDDYFRLDQIDPKVFDSESLKLLKAGDGWLLVGALQKDEKAEGALTLAEDQVEKLASLPVAPMNAIIGDPDMAAQMAMAASFRELFETELYAMLDIVHGSLKQAASEPKKRKAQIMSAIEAFKNFLSMGLDAIGGTAAKIEKYERQPKSTNKQEGDSDMDFKSEEFIKAVGDIVGPIMTTALSTLKDELKPAADKDADTKTDAEKKAEADAKVEAEKKAEADAKAKADGVDPNITALTATVKTLTEKVETLGSQLDTDPAGESQEDIDAKKTKAEKDAEAKAKAEAETMPVNVNGKWDDKKIDTSVFSGMLTKKKEEAKAA
jgi:hypothetical protein